MHDLEDPRLKSVITEIEGRLLDFYQIDSQVSCKDHVISNHQMTDELREFVAASGISEDRAGCGALLPSGYSEADPGGFRG